MPAPLRQRRRAAFDQGLAAAMRHAVYGTALPPLTDLPHPAEQQAFRTARDLTLRALAQVRDARP